MIWRVQFIDAQGRRCTSFIDAASAAAAIENAADKGVNTYTIFRVGLIDEKTGYYADGLELDPGRKVS